MQLPNYSTMQYQKLQSTEVSSKSATKIEITLDDTMTVDDLKKRMEEMEADDTDFEEIDE